jgi:diguanylate cyclase (GGDEF)-like protein
MTVGLAESRSDAFVGNKRSLKTHLGLLDLARFKLRALARSTPLSMLGHIVNVTIAIIAFHESIPAYSLLAWGVSAYSVAAYVLFRWIRRTPKPPSIQRSLKISIIYGALLAAPWGVLGAWLLGQLPQQQELILIALCVGMSASGSVLLSTIYPAAITYMACILAPVAIKCFFLLAGREYLLLGALTLCYAFFLLNCITVCARLFAEKTNAVQELEKSLSEIEHAAFHDALTGLKNRRALFDQPDTFSRFTSSIEASPYVLFYIDLDRFKPVNDAYGHTVGDELLKAVAGRLNTFAQSGSLIARIGGDEFVLLVDNIDDQFAAEAIASTIIYMICQPYKIADHLLTVGASIGIAFSNKQHGDIAHLLKLADMALYEAKNKRNQICCYCPSMLAKLEARKEMEDGLRSAVTENQFELHYQPIFDLRSLELVGAEALLRWRHPLRGLISPAEFLPLAEEMQLIHKIGEWVLDQAARQAMQWPKPLLVSVNLSPTQFMHTDITSTVKTILSATGLPADRLELEVTEAVILTDDRQTKKKLADLNGCGIGLAMDDFGTGYSSLGYLSRFPFERIKIDRTFVDGLLDNDSCASIVRATVDIARSLGMKTTAEGIETDAQLMTLQQLGIQFGQGYLFSKALPADEFVAYVGDESVLEYSRKVA